MSDIAAAMFAVMPAASDLVRDQVVFPAVGPALEPSPLGLIAGWALLRLVDGTVWMLRIPGSVWTPARLRAAAVYLMDANARSAPSSELTPGLAALLGLPAVLLVEPGLPSVLPEQWELSATASALWKRDRRGVGQGVGPRGSTAGALAIETALHEVLTRAIARFHAALDPKAREAATHDGRFRVAIYNYLVHPTYGRYRQQLAETFPGLLASVIDAAPGSLGAELRGVVDRGEPVVKSLAARWGVRPGVVRNLIGRPSSLIGEQWGTRMAALATLLHALIPEDMPQDDPDDWELLERVVVTGRSLFRKPVWQTSAGLRWARGAMHALKSGGPDAEQRWVPAAVAITRIDAFRGHLELALRREIGPVEASAHEEQSIAAVADDFLASHAPRGLEPLARRFFEIRTEALLERQRALKSSASELQRSLVPLLPEPLLSRDGTRVIRPLTDPIEVLQHGATLKLCLGDLQILGRYLYRCRRGYHFLLGVFDTATGEACSTVSIEAYSLHAMTVVEHAALANSVPSAECRAAVAELRAVLATDAARAWVREATKKRREASSTRLQRHFDEPDPRSLMQTTLGQQVYAGLVGKVRNRTG